MEVSAVSDFFRIRFNIAPDVSLSPETAIRNLEDDIKNLKKDISCLKDDLYLFQDLIFQDLKNLKKHLKLYKIPPKTIFDDESFWEMEPFL